MTKKEISRLRLCSLLPKIPPHKGKFTKEEIKIAQKTFDDAMFKVVNCFIRVVEKMES